MPSRLYRTYFAEGAMEDTDMQNSEKSDKGVGTHQLRLAEINTVPF